MKTYMTPEIKQHYANLVFESTIIKDEGGVEHEQLIPKEDAALGVLLLEGVVICMDDDDSAVEGIAWGVCKPTIRLGLVNRFYLWPTDQLTWVDVVEVPPYEMDLLFCQWWDDPQWGPVLWLLDYLEVKPPEYIVEVMRLKGIWSNHYEDFPEYQKQESDVMGPEKPPQTILSFWAWIKTWFQ
jgi:hypothetical protein